MPKLTFIQPDSTQVTVTAHNGTTVMNAARFASVKGILAVCGGSLNCGTCHVFVEKGSPEIPPPSAVENEMLDYTATPRQPESRLSCQIIVKDALDGCVFRVAPRQQ